MKYILVITVLATFISDIDFVTMNNHLIMLRYDVVGFWARHVEFVKWSKIKAPFSLRPSKDKASGKS